MSVSADKLKGESAVGKVGCACSVTTLSTICSNIRQSSLVLRFVKDQFDDYRESTIGAAFLTQTISLDENTTVKFEIWDTAGQERYKSLAPMYYRNANCAVVVYDITQAVSKFSPDSKVQTLTFWHSHHWTRPNLGSKNCKDRRTRISLLL